MTDFNHNSYQDFFRNISDEEKNYFDESPRIIVQPQTVNSASIDTFEIDGYRQGVEITSLKYFDAGTVKIHAGNPGHVMMNPGYGSKRSTTQTKYFTESDYFRPLNLVSGSLNKITTNTGSILLYQNADRLENKFIDGVLEPLKIRLNLDPFSPHSAYGRFGNGNENVFKETDQVENIFYFEPTRNGLPFYDLSRQFGNTPLPVVSQNKISITPFNDVRLIIGQLSSSFEAEFKLVLSPMTGSWENNLIPNGKKSATSGFYYSNKEGTDSIVFGEMIFQ